MSAHVRTAVYEAMECSIVSVESSFMRGFAGLQLIGSSTEVCRSGLERAKAALENTGIKIPPKKIVISTVPADIKKDGNQFDLPFAICIASLLQEDSFSKRLQGWVFVAELSLDGELHGVRGVVSYAISAMASGAVGIVVAKENVRELKALLDIEATEIKPIKIVGFEHLREVLDWVNEGCSKSLGSRFLASDEKAFQNPLEEHCSREPNFDDMILNQQMIDVAMVVAVGCHSLFLWGSPGTGKSMFSRRLTCIMPAMERQEHIDALKIHSSYTAGVHRDLLRGRPSFRAPHHQASTAALMGASDSPGEISLAHGGVLFLDEFPEYRRDFIESLREPLENGVVCVSRARAKISWKSRVILVGAANHCPCGWLGSSRKRCVCPVSKILAYRRKVSGPISDRIDIHINMKESMLNRSELFLSLDQGNTKRRKSLQTSALASKVEHIRKNTLKRNAAYNCIYNRDIKAEHIVAAACLSKSEFRELLLQQGCLKKLSTRGILKALRVARTLADLAESTKLRSQDLTAALKWSVESCAEERGDQAYGLG